MALLTNDLVNDAMVGAILAQVVYVVGATSMEGGKKKDRKGKKKKRSNNIGGLGGAVGDVGGVVGDVTKLGKDLPIVGSLLGSGNLLGALLNPYPAVAGAGLNIAIKAGTQNPLFGLLGAGGAGAFFVLTMKPGKPGSKVPGLGGNGLIPNLFA